MTLKHNQQIQYNHFRKDWQRRVRVHFDQPGRKTRRRNARKEKAAQLAPRPTDKLRPVVRCPTIKYNRRVRAGRGFTFAELKEAGIPRKLAPTIGISVDPRRVNLSEESLKANVERLKEFKSRLVVFPRKTKAPKKGDADPKTVEAAKQISYTGRVNRANDFFPIASLNQSTIKEGKLSDFKTEDGEGAYRKLRNARSEARLVGKREKRAKEKEEAAEASKK